jgi:hypothetical protein
LPLAPRRAGRGMFGACAWQISLPSGSDARLLEAQAPDRVRGRTEAVKGSAEYGARLHGRSDGGQHICFARPGPTQEFREQAAFAGSDRASVHHHLELPELTCLELHRLSQALFNQCGETRRFACRDGSRVTVNDSNGHFGEYRLLSLPATSSSHPGGWTACGWMVRAVLAAGMVRLVFCGSMRRAPLVGSIVRALLCGVIDCAELEGWMFRTVVDESLVPAGAGCTATAGRGATGVTGREPRKGDGAAASPEATEIRPRVPPASVAFVITRVFDALRLLRLARATSGESWAEAKLATRSTTNIDRSMP